MPDLHAIRDYFAPGAAVRGNDRFTMIGFWRNSENKPQIRRG